VFLLTIFPEGVEMGFLWLQISFTSNKHMVHCMSKSCWWNSWKPNCCVTDHSHCEDCFYISSFTMPHK